MCLDAVTYLDRFMVHMTSDKLNWSMFMGQHTDLWTYPALLLSHHMKNVVCPVSS